MHILNPKIPMCTTYLPYTYVQQVLEYRDKGVQKFQKIPIIEFSGSLINLINLVYRDFPGKIPVFEFFWENPGKSRYSRLIVTIKKIPVLRGSRYTNSRYTRTHCISNHSSKIRGLRST